MCLAPAQVLREQDKLDESATLLQAAIAQYKKVGEAALNGIRAFRVCSKSPQ